MRSWNKSLWHDTKPFAVAEEQSLAVQRHQITATSSKAKVSHIMLSPCPFLCPCSYSQDNKKESNQSAPGIKPPLKIIPLTKLLRYELERLNKETDHHLHLVLACHVPES